MRPQTLAEVAARTADDQDWPHHLNEFLDDFYRADRDLRRQAAMIAAPPPLIGDARVDAVLGGAGEHLARRWRLLLPRWTRDDARYLDSAFYWPDRAVRGYLLAVTPVSFRTRLIFTGPDPLQRARFPYRRGTLGPPLDRSSAT